MNQNPPLASELARHGLPKGWETIIDRLYAQKERYPCGAKTRFGGKAHMVMEVAFRTWEDHFTVWTGGTWGEGGKVSHTFTLNFDGTIDYQPQTKAA